MKALEKIALLKQDDVITDLYKEPNIRLYLLCTENT